MSTDFEKLAAEAEQFDEDAARWVDTERLMKRLAAALREAAQHVPREGWRASEYTRDDGQQVIAEGGPGVFFWKRSPFRTSLHYDTSREAIEAIEKREQAT